MSVRAIVKMKLVNDKRLRIAHAFTKAISVRRIVKVYLKLKFKSSYNYIGRSRNESSMIRWGGGGTPDDFIQKSTKLGTSHYF